MLSLSHEVITGICKGQYLYSGLTYISECFVSDFWFFFLENFTGIWDVK